MTNIEYRVENIKALIIEANNKLKSVNSENFNTTFPLVKVLLQKSQQQKNYLLTHYSRPELMIYDPELTKLAKQIKNTFDNIIEKKRIELNGVESRMKNIQNKKKLVNYIR